MRQSGADLSEDERIVRVFPNNSFMLPFRLTAVQTFETS